MKRLELVRQSLAYCYHSPFRDKLSESLYFYIEKLIKDRDVESVKKVWPIYTQIAANAENDQIAFAQTLSNDLKSLLTEKKLHVEPLKAILDLLSALDLPNSYTLEILDSFSLQNKQSEIFAKTVDQCLSSENNFDSAEQKINDFIIELDKQSHDSQKSELNP